MNIGLIDQIARHCLDQGYHVVLDGILYADWYELIRSWETQARPRPYASRSMAATVLLPDPEFPRTTMSRVPCEPIAMPMILGRPL